METKEDLKSLSRKELLMWFEKRGYPSFRASQLFNWIYRNGVDEFSRMNNLPLVLREELEEKSYLTKLKIVNKSKAEDGTVKYLWELKDGETIESVFIPYEGSRNSVCISSQVGCSLGCKFCATGLTGLIRNLTPGEIVDQVLQIQKEISNDKYGSPRVSNVVFMGMGEPLANMKSVLKAIEIMNDSKGLNIGKRKITVSTSGLVPQIKELADKKLQIVLAISLNAPNNALRDKLMPINRKFPLEKLLEAVRYYTEVTNRRVTFEYVLLKGTNDSPEHAFQLVNLLSDIHGHVNLIPFNPVQETEFKRPSKETVNRFKDILINNGVETTVRQERGTRIEAACGQLRRLNY
ncbi:23S rRNA (adenine(2503)-C(2))-methyltransferase RlmN [Halothermothrix orenii]|uniref:Probable dual-specificity RNA methyltransferase RlmN n=1 Tax=Halothermothrix orenii (strain H 168 / OCM 544 / DSM 9562) TaxID=373903 RepID=B8CWT1_HALOH|nr:23S rRNA (adenine(2503)-C(2))-methyltransferase RlmN [Halothermothrix orenii]ACL69750.1 radical SAM enzyme, Cfr family [Halothermothrix orenii H 168]